MDIKQKYRLCAQAAEDKKAENLVIIDVTGLTDMADYFVIASGTSDKQVQAIADGIQEKMKESKVYPLGVEGYSEGKWVLMDYGDLIVHIFYAPIRGIYDLERIWQDARKVRRRKAAKPRSTKAG